MLDDIGWMIQPSTHPSISYLQVDVVTSEADAAAAGATARHNELNEHISSLQTTVQSLQDDLASVRESERSAKTEIQLQEVC